MQSNSLLVVAAEDTGLRLHGTANAYLEVEPLPRLLSIHDYVPPGAARVPQDLVYAALPASRDEIDAALHEACATNVAGKRARRPPL